MLFRLLCARWSRRKRFVWSPALDLGDATIYSTLLPGTHA
jgi:hypothetical protein